MFTNELPSVEADIAARLAKIRTEMEAGGDKLAAVEVPAALLLADVCDALALTDVERSQVLGDSGVAFVEDVKVTPVHLKNGRQSLVKGAPSVQ